MDLDVSRGSQNNLNKSK